MKSQETLRVELVCRMPLPVEATFKRITADLPPDELAALLDHLVSIDMTNDKCMKEYNCGKSVGIEQERKRIVILLQCRATTHFHARQDEQAKYLRNLVDGIQVPQAPAPAAVKEERDHPAWDSF